jgi:serine/threonine-protein kinase
MRCAACGRDNPEGLPACAGCGAALAPPTTVFVTLGLRPGDLFHGRFEILAPLGQGGMGVVYKARDRSLDEVVAIKVLRPDFARDPLMAERFKSEIRLARRVRHRNVSAIHDFGEADGLLYISMELVEGVDLKRVVREQGPLPTERAYDVVLQVAAGLQAVHEAGIVHRDLKTPNIMLEPGGVARLMDFGIAKREDAEGGVTVTGQVVGTPEYMSPEQAQGRKVDARTDVYSLGVVVYEVFTGRVPFRGDTPISTILKHLQEPPPLDGPPAERLPARLREVLRRALAKEPADRYPTVAAFADALREARSPSRRQQPLSTAALEATTVVVPPPRRAAPRRRTALVLGALAGVLAVAAIAVSWVLWPRTPVDTAESLLSPAPAGTPTPRPEVAVPPAPPARPSPTVPPSPTPAPPASRPPADGSPTRAPRTVVPSLPVPTPPPSPTPPRAAGVGLLQVGVRPWAEVSVDGRVIGTTPLDKIPLAAGRHVVRLRHPAYGPVEKEVVVAEGQTARLVFDFTSAGAPRHE